MVMKVQSAHAPGLVLVQLEIEINICHRVTSTILCEMTKIHLNIGKMVETYKTIEKTL
jgi:hypothetical protein